MVIAALSDHAVTRGQSSNAAGQSGAHEPPEPKPQQTRPKKCVAANLLTDIGGAHQNLFFPNVRTEHQGHLFDSLRYRLPVSFRSRQVPAHGRLRHGTLHRYPGTPGQSGVQLLRHRRLTGTGGTVNSNRQFRGSRISFQIRPKLMPENTALTLHHNTPTASRQIADQRLMNRRIDRDFSHTHRGTCRVLQTQIPGFAPNSPISASKRASAGVSSTSTVIFANAAGQYCASYRNTADTRAVSLISCAHPGERRKPSGSPASMSLFRSSRTP